MDNSNKNILVVDDEKPLSLALSLKLKKEGYNVDVANDGKQAIDSAKAKDYSLILLDLVMPNISGFEVLEELGKHSIKTPVIVMSNLSQDEDMKKAKTFGVVDYMVKANSSLSEIIERIKNFFNTARVDRQ